MITINKNTMSTLEKMAPSKTQASEIIKNNQDYTIFSWSKQKGTNPIAVKHAKGVYLYDYDGKRYIDFSSGLMNVNIGHGDQRVTQSVMLQLRVLPKPGVTWGKNLQKSVPAI